MESHRRSVLLMIQDLIENVKLTPQEQNIVDYIDRHPKEVMILNAKELSEKIFVSPPTMNRFIKKLGFSGYFDFQLTFIQEQNMAAETKHKRIEIKFSTVMKANESVINRSNAIDQCKKANLGNRALSSDDMYNYNFDCNIQQVKRAEFDFLYYGLFFADKIAIFQMSSDEIQSCFGYSDKQHKGNEGEGQFHLNRKSIDYHMKNHFVQWLTYEELYNLLSNL